MALRCKPWGPERVSRHRTKAPEVRWDVTPSDISRQAPPQTREKMQVQKTRGVGNGAAGQHATPLLTTIGPKAQNFASTFRNRGYERE